MLQVPTILHQMQEEQLHPRFPQCNHLSALNGPVGLAAKKAHDLGRTHIAATSTIEEISDLAIAAISAPPDSLLMATSSVLGTGDDWVSDEYVLADLTVPHVVWHATILSTSSSAPSSPIPMLIDCGSPSVLIRENIVEHFQLH
ncbi:hypothetical protein BKA93DRAFT_829134 [Sparassis latifolia]